MTQNTTRIVEYSILKKQFHIHDAAEAIINNLHTPILGVQTVHLLNGIFAFREIANIFSERFQRRLLATNGPQKRAPASLGEAAGSFVRYGGIIKLLQNEFVQQPYGSINEFCQPKSLTYNTIISFLKDKTTYQSPPLIIKLLVALDYGVRMHKVFYPVDKKKEGLTEELSCYLVNISTDTEHFKLP